MYFLFHLIAILFFSFLHLSKKWLLLHGSIKTLQTCRLWHAVLQIQYVKAVVHAGAVCCRIRSPWDCGWGSCPSGSKGMGKLIYFCSNQFEANESTWEGTFGALVFSKLFHSNSTDTWQEVEMSCREFTATYRSWISVAWNTVEPWDLKLHYVTLVSYH